MERFGVGGNTHGFKLLVEPASDVPGSWLAHILDIDVVTYGGGFREAMDLGLEAAALVVSDDLANGLNPLDRARAPIEVYRRVARIMESQCPPMTVEEIEARIAAGDQIAALFLVRVDVGRTMHHDSRLVGQPAPLDHLAA
ncbi:MAG: hypothetical protein R3F65_10545 [bacterium]